MRTRLGMRPRQGWGNPCSACECICKFVIVRRRKKNTESQGTVVRAVTSGRKLGWQNSKLNCLSAAPPEPAELEDMPPLLTFGHPCSPLLSFGLPCSPLLSCALLCSPLLSFALLCSPLLSFAPLCSPLLSLALRIPLWPRNLKGVPKESQQSLYSFGFSLGLPGIILFFFWIFWFLWTA